jgi:hypothetical protein
MVPSAPTAGDDNPEPTANVHVCKPGFGLVSYWLSPVCL